MVLNSTETILYLFAARVYFGIHAKLSCIYLSDVASTARRMYIISHCGRTGCAPCARSFTFRHRCRFKAAFDSFLIFGRGTHERVLCTLLFLPLLHATSLIDTAFYNLIFVSHKINFQMSQMLTT